MIFDSIVMAIVILAFLTSFSIGANDAANALATSYGSNAAKLIYLIILGGLFEFIGAYYCSSHVAGTLVSSVVVDVDALPELTVEKMMLGTSISSFLFIILSSGFGMPISGTHTVVGALIGSGMATLGSKNINWEKLSVIVVSWFVAPAVAAMLAMMIMSGVAGLTMNPRVKLSTRLCWLTLITALSSTLIATMLIGVTKETDDPFSAIHWMILAVAFVVGLILSRLVLLVLTIGQESLSCGMIAGSMF